MDACLMREWKQRFVSGLTKLAFNSSSVKLHEVIKKYPSSLNNLEARMGYADTGDPPDASFSSRAIAS